MSKKEYFPKRIFIEKDSFDYPLTRKIIKNTLGVPSEIIENPQNLIDEIKLSEDPKKEGKKYLLITQQRGEFIKPCPCTSHYIGCNYFIINLDINCPLDCSYCILQHYLSNPMIVVHVNTKDMWKPLDAFLYRNRKRILRIGTGELGDSLALDHITERSRDLISYFKNRKNVIFELKTKTVNIKNILDIEPADNIVIAWSLNSNKIARTEEKNAPSVNERIEAARQVKKRGYRVAFHFDPIIHYPGWEEGYGEVINELFRKINPFKIAWISLGSLRFHPDLKTIIKERFPETRIIYDEFIRGKDGKLRYFKPIRFQLYKRIVSLINRNCGGKVPLYFCMESAELWERILMIKPKGKEEVEKYLSLPFGKLKISKSKLT